MHPIVRPGHNCWRIDACTRATPIIDAADYFHLVRQVMADADEDIIIIGWDFDVRICLEPQDEDGCGPTLGEFFLQLARENPRRRIHILKWGFGAYKQFLRPRAAWMLWRWHRTRRIQYRFDRAHPVGCSHHQKILVLDDVVAVCGGIDLSTARWDTPEHRDNDPRRRLPDGKPYPPWHDVTMMLEGPVAKALGELGRERWQRATNTSLPAPESGDTSPWPQKLVPEFRDMEVAIARTRAAHNGCSEVRENEALYLDMIAAARDFIYIENQYFTSGKIAGALRERLQDGHPPEIVLVMPRTADGWLEQKAMDAARVQLVRRIAEVDTGNHFRVYVPVTPKRTDIYVHAKVSIVDDRFLRIGSSNMNNRSMGLDSECDVIIDAALPANRDTPPAIAALRTRLLAEHLGVEPERFEAAHREHSALIPAIESLRGDGKTLDLLDLAQPGPLDEFIAEHELLDPDEADGMLDPMQRRGLRKHLHRGGDWIRRRLRGKHRG